MGSSSHFCGRVRTEPYSGFLPRLTDFRHPFAPVTLSNSTVGGMLAIIVGLRLLLVLILIVRILSSCALERFFGRLLGFGTVGCSSTSC